MAKNNIPPQDLEPGFQTPGGSPNFSGNTPLSGGGSGFGKRGGFNLNRFYKGLFGQVGGQTLTDLLASRGSTDPRQLNLGQADIFRQASGTQAGLRGAGYGVGDSGALAALDAAIGLGAGESAARLRADEAQKAEERKRQDLAMLLGLLNQQKAFKLQKYGIRKQAAAQGGGSPFDFGGLLNLADDIIGLFPGGGVPGGGKKDIGQTTKPTDPGYGGFA